MMWSIINRQSSAFVGASLVEIFSKQLIGSFVEFRTAIARLFDGRLGLLLGRNWAVENSYDPWDREACLCWRKGIAREPVFLAPSVFLKRDERLGRSSISEERKRGERLGSCASIDFAAKPNKIMQSMDSSISHYFKSTYYLSAEYDKRL